MYTKQKIANNELIEVFDIGKDGKPIINPSGTFKSAPNFMKLSENDVFIRGTGQDARKKELIYGVMMYRQQNYWVNGDRMADILKHQEII